MSRLPKRINLAVRLVLAAGLLFSVVLPGPPAAASSGQGKVVIFVIDQVGFQEISESNAPELKQLIKRGGVGVASVKSKDNLSSSPQYLAIGAGNKASGVVSSSLSSRAAQAEALEGFGARERIDGRAAVDIYFERTGRKFAGGAAANLSISALTEANSSGDFNAIPGSLGDALQKNGLKTAAIGNADSTAGYGRAIINILMNKRGLVDYGWLDKSLLIEDGGFPSGHKTDPDKLMAAFTAAYGMADVVAIEWGDTSRVRAETDFITAGRESTLLKASITRADSFVAKMLDTMDLTKDLLIIVSPAVSAGDAEVTRLVAPVVMAGRGVDPGLLTSASTRRPGAVINVDIAPTILNHFDIDLPSDMTGRPAFTRPADGDTLKTVIDTTERWVTVRSLMGIVLRILAYWDIFILALFIGLLLTKKYRKYASKIRWALLTVPAIPLVFLLLPILGYGSAALVIMEAAVLTAVLVAAAVKLSRNPVEAVGMIGLTTAAAVLIDLGTGALLAQDSMLGYSVLGGARFYGIGNEFSGVLIGSIVISAFYVATIGSYPINNLRKTAIAALFIVSMAMMGAPNLGAEFGNLVAAVPGFGILALGIFRGKYKAKDILMLTGLGFAGIAIFIGYDLSAGESGGSHVGRLAAQIRAEGLAPLYTIVGRKIAMNITLIQFAFWNWVNVASASALAIAFYGLKNLLKLVFQRYPYFKPTMIGGLICCLGALVLNDSGVVSMAMIFLYLVPATLYLMTYET